MAQPAGFDDDAPGEVEEHDAEVEQYDERTILDVVQTLSAEEGRALFDQRTRTLMGISGEEFLQRLDAGEFNDVYDTPEYPDLVYLTMISALGR